MKKLFLSSFIIITSFFFVNNVKAADHTFIDPVKINSNFLNEFVVDYNDIDSIYDNWINNASDETSKNGISNLLNSFKNLDLSYLSNMNYLIVLRNTDITIYNLPKADYNTLYFNFLYWYPDQWTNKIVLTPFINETFKADALNLSRRRIYKKSSSSDVVINPVSPITSGEITEAFTYFDQKNNFSYNLTFYIITNMPIKYNSTLISRSEYYKIADFYFVNGNEEFPISNNTLLINDNHDIVFNSIKPEIDFIHIDNVLDSYNNIIGVHLFFNVINDYSSDYHLVYQYVDDINNLSDIWLPCFLVNPLTKFYSFDFNSNGVFVLGYFKDDSSDVNILATALVDQIVPIDMFSIDITNTEGIVLIPKTDSFRYSSNIYFSAPDEFINQYKSNPNFYFKYSNRSLHLANVNNFNIDDLFSQEKLINNFSPGDGLTEIIDKNNYNISLFRAEKPDYIVSNDRPMIISFDRNVYNYQILGDHGSDSDNTTIIDPNTGKPIIVDSFKETDFFTLMKHAFSRFTSVIRNIFKLVSTFFYSLPSTLNYFFVLVMFFIVLLLFLKFLI